MGDQGLGVDASRGEEPHGGIPGARRAHRANHLEVAHHDVARADLGQLVGVVAEDADASARPHRLDGRREGLRASGALQHDIGGQAVPGEGGEQLLAGDVEGGGRAEAAGQGKPLGLAVRLPHLAGARGEAGLEGEEPDRTRPEDEDAVPESDTGASRPVERDPERLREGGGLEGHSGRKDAHAPG